MTDNEQYAEHVDVYRTALAKYHALAESLEKSGIKTCSTNSAGVHIYRVDDLLRVAVNAVAHDVRHEGNCYLTRHWEATVDGLPVSACEAIPGPVQPSPWDALLMRAEAAESKCVELTNRLSVVVEENHVLDDALSQSDIERAELRAHVCALRLLVELLGEEDARIEAAKVRG